MRKFVLIPLLWPLGLVAQTPEIASNGVVNGATFDARFSPGIQASIFGRNLSDGGTCQYVRGAPAPTTLCNTRVTINGIPSPIFFASPGQVNIQIPVELPPGRATFVLEVLGRGSSSATVQLATHSPGLFSANFSGTGLGIFLRMRGTLASQNNPVNPGELVAVFGLGLGPTNPVAPSGREAPLTPPSPTVTQPRLTVGGRPAQVLFSGLAAGQMPGWYVVNFVVPGDLTPGSYPVVLEIAGFTSNTVVLPVAITGMVLTQSGFTFQAVQGGGAPSPQSFRILNGTAGVLNFNMSTSTLSGGSGWLSVSPTTGASDPAQAAPTIDVRVNPAGLSPGDYYGQVRVEAPAAPNSPQVVTAVLNVSASTVNPGPVVAPTGLVFVGVLGTANPVAQSVRITNLTARPTSFTTTATFAGGRNWFTHSPASGNVAPGTPATITIAPNLTGLALGIQRGSLVIDFPQDTTSRVVDLLLVVAPRLPAASQDNALTPEPGQGACTAAQLLPVFTLLGNNFNTTAAWPTPIEVVVVDNCGGLLRTGSVTTTFSNNDPPLALVPQQDGRWSGTWAPRNARTESLKVTVTARSETLQGTAEVSGNARANPDVPTVDPKGVVSAASYLALPSPGELISVFGKKLANGLEEARRLPLPTELQGALVSLGGRPLPLIFTSEGQINAVVPYGIASGTTHQLVARRGNRISVPEPVVIAPSQPAVFTTDSSGRGQGHIYVFPSATEQILANAARPARAGDAMVIYCGGLGAVDPPAEAGTATPADTLRRTASPVTVTIGDRPATVVFAGLTPGFTGLYQINVTVPEGITASPAAPVVVSVAGASSPPVTIAVQ